MNERFKQLRKTLKLNQNNMATMLFVSQQTISNYESGRLSLPNEILDKLRKELKVNLNWLVSGDGEVFTETWEDILEEARDNHALRGLILQAVTAADDGEFRSYKEAIKKILG